MRIIYLFLLCEILFTENVLTSEMKFTNIRCTNLSSIVRYDVCRINAINRTVNSLTVIATLDRPLNRGTVDFIVLKRANGWKKFLYEFKDIDCCEFLRNKHRNKVVKFFYSYLEQYSNVNHPCPYEGSLIFDGLTLSKSTMFPIPPGEYGMRILWKYDNVPAAQIEGFISYSNYRESWI